MKKIFLTQAQFVIVDDKDYEWLNQYSWYAAYHISNDSYYATRSETLPNGKQRIVLMHRQILGLKYGDKRQGDHIHHKTLDNRRSELKVATRRENGSNRKDKSSCTSKYVGVAWHKPLGQWRAQIKINKHKKHLGYFDVEKDASDVYQNALAKL